jgi:hypothetical protein
MKPTVGFGPTTAGLQNRCSENTSPDKTETYEDPKTQLTPESRKQGGIDTQNLPVDLAEIVAVWPKLPEHIRQAIKVLVESYIRVGAGDLKSCKIS